MRAVAVVVLGIAVAAGCRGGARPPAQASTTVLPSIEAQPAAPDDPIVARVDGRPVYGSCVAMQATALHEDRRRALDDCVAFELLAGAAARRGVARDPDVIDGYRRALVGRFVDAEFRARYQRADDLPPALRDAAFEKFKWRMHRPEYRYAVYVRAPLGDKATTADDAAAHALAQDIYDALAGRADLFPPDLFAATARVANGRKVETMHTPYGTGLEGPGDPSFTTPLFAIPAIGMLAPPARTKWGWDVLLWTDTMTPLETSKEGVMAWLFPQLRRGMFDDWVDGLAKDRDVDVRLDEARLATLVDQGEAAGVGAAAAPRPGGT